MLGFSSGLLLALMLSNAVPSAQVGYPYGVLPPNRTPLAVVRDSLHVRYMRSELSWAVAQPTAGPISYSTANDRTISAIEAAGLRMFPSLTIGRAAWINGHNEPDGDTSVAHSFPPLDMTASAGPQYGYSHSYYDFVFSFISHYRGHFDYVAIENEPNSSLYWGGTADEYVRLVKTAYLAIKAADPAVRVTDGGIVSTALGLALAKDRLIQGQMTHDQAVNFAYEFVTKDLPRDTIDPRLDSPEEVAAQIDNAQSSFNTLTWPKVNTILDGVSGSVDALNFHFYESPLFLRDIAEWLKERQGRAPHPYSVPMLSNEVGVRSTPDLGCATPVLFSSSELARQADLTMEKLIVARAVSLERFLFFSIDSVCTNAPNPSAIALVSTDYISLRPAGEVFAAATQMFGTEAVYDQTLADGPSLHAFAFKDSTGRRRFIGAWSDSGTSTLSVDTHGAATVTVLDASARATSTAVTGATMTFQVSRPVIIRLDAPARTRAVRR